MTTHKEALTLALEALEICEKDGYIPVRLTRESITAIKEALAQPEQEPVAWGNLANWCLDSDRVLITDKDEAAKYHKDVYDLTPLYATPPQRKPLTDEQIQAVAFEAVKDNWDWLKFARAIEAAHGIKGDA